MIILSFQNNERSTVTKQSLATNDDNNAIIYAMQKQISDLQVSMSCVSECVFNVL